MQRSRIFLGVCFAFALTFVVGAGGDSPVDPASVRLADSKKLLDDGKSADALAKAQEGLEFAPDNFALLQLAAQSASAAEKKDEAVWYAGMAIDQSGGLDPKSRQKTVDDLNALAAAADPLQQKNRAVEGDYAQALLKVGADLSRRQMYVTAVGILTRLRGTSVADKADVELGKIYDNKKAVAALLDSGLDVPIKPRKKRDPARESKEDKKHETWDKCWEIKGDSYTIRTTLGKELADQISGAMEQMNHFYRKVFHVKEFGGGTTARCTLAVYKDRAEFDSNEPGTDKNVLGFFVPNVNRVATYDLRPEGGKIAELWSTLFHESSHQFTHMVSADLIPGWLNEGTASYFEGARLLSNGTVETNLVAEGRLMDLKVLLDQGKPSLKEVVSYFKPGSYDGEFYPFGWGLVYFIQNYENEKSERVYIPIYRDYLLSYKSAGKPDAFGHFVDFFVTKAKQPGVKTFEDFEKLWKDWIQKLHHLYTAGPEAADELIARARKEKSDKQTDAAIESYTWALQKRPTDAVGYLERADVHLERKETDAALFDLRHAQECLRAVADPEAKLPGAGTQSVKDLTAACEAKLLKLDKATSDQLAAADQKFQAACLETAQAYADAKSPLVAMQLLEDGRNLIGVVPKFDALRKKIGVDTGADTRRWRRIVNESLDEYEASEQWTAANGTLTVKSKQLRFAYWKGELPSRFRFDVHIDASKVDGAVGLLFGGNSESVQLFVVVPDLRKVLPAKLKKEIELGEPMVEYEEGKGADLNLAMEVRDGEVEFFLDGQSIKTLPFTPDDLKGQIGAFSDGGTATFTQMRLRY